MGSLAPSLGAATCPTAVYRPRRPRATSLYQLLDTYHERLKDSWEQRFERRYGFWRGFYDTAVMRYLDGGLFESGFARAVCFFLDEIQGVKRLGDVAPRSIRATQGLLLRRHWLERSIALG